MHDCRTVRQYLFCEAYVIFLYQNTEKRNKIKKIVYNRV